MNRQWFGRILGILFVVLVTLALALALTIVRGYFHARGTVIHRDLDPFYYWSEVGAWTLADLFILKKVLDSFKKKMVSDA